VISGHGPEVYELGLFLCLPDEIVGADNFRLEQGEERVLFCRLYHKIAVVLCGTNNRISPREGGKETALTEEQVSRVCRGIQTERKFNLPPRTYLTLNVLEFEIPPPGKALNTVTCAVPAVAMSVAGIAAVTRVPETYVVVRFDPFHRTTDSETNPLPLTIIVNAESFLFAEFGLMLVIFGVGLLIATVPELEVPPPGVGVNTVTCAVPATAMSDAGIAAVNPVPETYVVVRLVPFQ
jgi:hypothetical protein